MRDNLSPEEKEHLTYLTARAVIDGGMKEEKAKELLTRDYLESKRSRAGKEAWEDMNNKYFKV